MDVIDEKSRIEDELETLSFFFSKLGSFVALFVRDFGPEKYIIQGGSLHRSCIWEC